MSTGNHRITPEQAKNLISRLKSVRNKKRGFLKDLPEGFMFPVEVVRHLVNHSQASHFVIQFGWKELASSNNNLSQLTPVLFVTDAMYNPLDEEPLVSMEAIAPSGMADDAANFTEAFSSRASSGGFVNEGQNYPPVAR